MSSSFSQSKTPGIIVSEIRMMASAFKGTHFLLEGEDDCKFWKHYLKLDNVTLVDCGGKTNLIGAAKQLLQKPVAPVAGVYDSDFDRLCGIPPHAPTLLVATDANDLETTMLISDALKRVLSESADVERLRAFEASRGITTINYVEQTAREFGRLRLLNLIAGHKVNFAQLSPYRYVAVNDWSFDLHGLRQEYAKQASISLETLESALQQHCPSAVAWAYAQGHDALRILAQGLRRTIGEQQMDEKDLAKHLRLAFSQAMLEKTSMYASLRGIEAGLSKPLFG